MCGMRWNPEECSMQACCRGFDFLKIYKKESRDHLSGWQETIGNETCLNFANQCSTSFSCFRGFLMFFLDHLVILCNFVFQ